MTGDRDSTGVSEATSQLIPDEYWQRATYQGREWQPKRTAAHRNPEQDVIDAIDELVNESLARGPQDDYNKPYSEVCPQCGGSWHGLRRGNCPGATGIEGNPEEGARRSDDVFARNAEEGDNPLSRLRDNVSVVAEHVAVVARLWRAIDWLTSDHHRLPPPTTVGRRYPGRLRLLFPTRNDVCWQHPGPTTITVEAVEVECFCRPNEDDQFNSSYVYEVVTRHQGETNREWVVITREYLVAARGGQIIHRVPLPHLGVDGHLRLLQGGAVVLEIPNRDGSQIAAQMGFVGAGASPWW